MTAFSVYAQNLIIDGAIRGTPTAWAATTAYAQNQLIYGTANTPNGKIMICTVAGTSGGSQPTWPAIGSTVTDGGATWKALAVGAPQFGPTLYAALLLAGNGVRANSTAYTSGQYITIPISGKCYLYLCTTSGTTASSIPGTYLGTPDEVITDGTAVFTEQTTVLKAAGAAINEVTGNNYSRTAVTMSSANLSAAGSTVNTATTSTANPSTGVSGQTFVIGAINFPIPSGAWNSAASILWGLALYDAPTGGNLIWVGGMKQAMAAGLNNTPSFQAATNGSSTAWGVAIQVDNT